MRRFFSKSLYQLSATSKICVIAGLVILLIGSLQLTVGEMLDHIKDKKIQLLHRMEDDKDFKQGVLQQYSLLKHKISRAALNNLKLPLRSRGMSENLSYIDQLSRANQVRIIAMKFIKVEGISPKIRQVLEITAKANYFNLFAFLSEINQSIGFSTIDSFKIDSNFEEAENSVLLLMLRLKTI